MGLLTVAVTAALAAPAAARPTGAQEIVMDAYTGATAWDATQNRYVATGYYRFNFAPVAKTVPPAGGLGSGLYMADGDYSESHELHPDVVHNPHLNEYFIVSGTAERLRGFRYRADGTSLGRFTISNLPSGPEGRRPAVAYDTARREYVVVQAATLDGRSVIRAHRVLPTGGTPASWTVSDRPELVRNLAPEIAYRASLSEHLIVWQGVRSDGSSDVFAQRLRPGTGELGTEDRKVSDHRNLAGRVANVTPVVAHRGSASEALVAWSDGYEIYGRRLTGTDAVPGRKDERYSTMGADGDRRYTAVEPDVAYHPLAREYAIVWEGKDTGDEEQEIYAQHVTEAAGQIGPDDVQVSVPDPDEYGWSGARWPSLAADPGTRGYLATYLGGYPIGEAVLAGRRLVAER
jgi:hypothetical protein